MARATGAQVLVLKMDEEPPASRRSRPGWGSWESLLALARYSRRLRRTLQSVQPEVVIGRSLRAAIYGRLACVGLRVPFVWSVHDRLTREYLGPSAPLFSTLLPRLVDGIIANSVSTATTLRSPRRPLLVLPPSARRSEVGRLHRPRDEQDSSPRIVVLGRLAEWKGQDLAVRAFEAVAEQFDAVLDIAGAALFDEGSFEERLRRQVADSTMPARIRLLGHVDDPMALLAEADVLLHCSRLPEPFGAVVLEGMRAEVVVVATEPGGPSEVIDHGVTGWLATAGDVGALEDALRSALSMPRDDRAAMVAEAAALADRFDSSVLTPRLIDWLGLLVEGRAPRMTHAVAGMSGDGDGA
nr:glycosyltransferase family 4 protein [Nocardioides sp. Arc9.136]